MPSANVAATTSTVKKLARYCCQECGAKELYLYCWKGCRHVQNLKTFYSETKSICQELDTLKETIYAQELRLRNAEVLLKEKQQSLDVLMAEVKRLPQLRSLQHDKTKPTKTDTFPRTALPSGLPAWTTAAVTLLIETYDSDQDGRLDRKDLDILTQTIGKTHPSFDAIVWLDQVSKQWADVDSIVAYYGHVGASQLSNDLQAAGVQFGATAAIALGVAQTIDSLHRFSQQAKDLDQEVTTLKSEINEKSRTTTRLREGFAEAKLALDGKDTEIQRVHQHRTHVDKELQSTKDQMTTLSTQLKQLTGDLTARNTAIHDLRALVEDQVHEKEKWQRYCWELEERLYEAVHTSHAKERDLWKTRDAKKEETRKNMLLYMDRGMGKKHFRDGETKGPLDEMRDVSVASEAAQTDSSCCSDPDTGTDINTGPETIEA